MHWMHYKEVYQTLRDGEAKIGTHLKLKLVSKLLHKPDMKGEKSFFLGQKGKSDICFIVAFFSSCTT